MDNRNIDNSALKSNEDENSSFYLDGDVEKPRLDLEGLFSYQFANIRSLYTSLSGHTEIYSATRYGKRYILKGLKEELRNDPVYNLALAKEFEIAITLDHPYIRRTFSIETVGDIGKVIVMEYIDGMTLKTLIESGQLSLPAGRAIAAQLMQALGYMHDKQIFHRDLKPSNILIAKSNRTVKIIDFSLSDSDDFIVLKNPAGSKKYMAPEQFAGQSAPSAVADIYSLGVVLEEIAAATDDEELAEVARRCAHPRPEKRPDSVSRIKLPTSKSTIQRLFSRALSSRLLTYIMLSVCLTLGSLVAYMITTR